MKDYINKFIFQLFVFSVALGLITYCLTFFLSKNYFSPVLPFLFPFFFSATVIVYNYIVKSVENKFSRFVNRFMLTTFLKLMVYMAVLLTYVFTHKEDAVTFILSFFLLYVAYTAFEVVAMLKFSKTPQKK